MNYLSSYEFLTTVYVFLVILLKLLVNSEVTPIQLKKIIACFPGEIVFLLIGYLLASIIKKTEESALTQDMIVLGIMLIIIILLYSLEKYLMDKLGGSLSRFILFILVVIYVFAIISYYFIVFGGII